MTVKEALQLSFKDLKVMSEKALRKIANTLGGASNKRLARLRKLEKESPAIRGLTKDFRFKRGGATKGDLLAAIAQNKAFLEKKSSTVKGFKEELQEAKARARKRLAEQNISLSEDAFNRFWDAYDRLVEKNPSLYDSKEVKYAILELSNILDFSEMSDEEIEEAISTRADEVYKEQVQEDEPFSNAFDAGSNL